MFRGHNVISQKKNRNCLNYNRILNEFTELKLFYYNMLDSVISNIMANQSLVRSIRLKFIAIRYCVL